MLKLASVKLATVTSSIEGFDVYRRSPDIGEKLKRIESKVVFRNNLNKLI